MAYFGTDQSQVGRYLGGKSKREIRIGMSFTALIKIPMQLFILGLGLMLFTTMHFSDEPIWHNPSVQSKWQSISFPEVNSINRSWESMIYDRRENAIEFSESNGSFNQELKNELVLLHQKRDSLKNKAEMLLLNNYPGIETKDTDYVFLGWALKSLPMGLLGLLLAVIFSGAMSSCSAELNALSATSIVDFKETFGKKKETSVFISRALTTFWGFLALIIAMSASLSENLIQLVNIIGSLFYGPMLGLFACAWIFPRFKSFAVFMAGMISQILVLVLHLFNNLDIIHLGYLWYNLIGCICVVFISSILSLSVSNK